MNLSKTHCVKCTRLITSLATEAFICNLCKKPWHINCTEGFNERTSESVIEHFRKRSKIFKFQCPNCSKGKNLDPAIEAAKAPLLTEVAALRVQLGNTIKDSSGITAEISDLKRKKSETQKENDKLTYEVARLRNRNTELMRAEASAVQEGTSSNDSALIEMRKIAKEASDENRAMLAAMRQLEIDNKLLQEKVQMLESEKPKHVKVAQMAHTGKRTRTQSDMSICSESETDITSLSDTLFKFMRRTDEKFDRVMGLLTTKQHTAAAPTRTVIVANEEPQNQRTRSASRGRSQSRGRTNSCTPVQHNARIPTTYAQALQASKTPIETIRNINVVGTPQQMDDTIQKLRFDESFSTNSGIRSVKQKGGYSLTVKCVNEEEALKVEKQIRERYVGVVEVKTVDRQPPMIFTKLQTSQEIQEQLNSQNTWIRDGDFEITEMYQVPTIKGTYTNIVAKCTIESQKRLLERGKVIFGLAECNIYEHIKLIQCYQCQKYGHFARECRQLPHCRLCAGTHNSKDCDDESGIRHCANCLSANKKGERFNTRHRASDENCPCRLGRIEGLKHFVTQKN